MITLLLGLLLSLPAQVGEAAPPVTAESWLNGDAPDLAGQPVLVEFWGTWCGPCVASMPHVQDLWTRYREQGLRVVAISYEAPEVMRPFLEKHGYTMLVGSDPRKECIQAFDVKGWPTTVVIDRAGKIAYRGFPASAEPYVQQVLGLDTSAVTLLTRYLDDGGQPQETLEQLVRNASHAFAIGPWAQAQGGTASPRPPKDVGETLSNLASTWSSPMKAAPLGDLAAATEPFDLKTLARRELARRFPIPDEDFAALVEAGSYADVLEAVVSRNPSDEALRKAKSDDGLRDWANERSAKYRENAATVVTQAHWMYGEYETPEEIHLPPGTAVCTDRSPDGRDQVSGLILNTGETLMETDYPACVADYLGRTVAIAAFAKRKVPDLAKGVDKLHDELLDDLRKKYGDRKKKVSKDS